MKRIVICIVLSIIIFLGGIGSLYYTCRISDDILDSLEQAQRMYSEGNSEGAAQAVSQVRKSWNKFRDIHIFTVDNGHALEITMSMAKIESLLERDDEEIITECRVMGELVEVYRNEMMPSIMNVM